MNNKYSVKDLGVKAKKAASLLTNISNDQKNEALNNLKKNLQLYEDELIIINKKDIDNALARKLSVSIIDRLTLNSDRIKGMMKSLDDIMNWLHSEELDTQFSCKGGYSSFEAAEKHRRMPNKIYWCNRNPRTKSYVPKRGEKSSSRKLPAGQRCPAIIQIRAQKVVLPNQGMYFLPS